MTEKMADDDARAMDDDTTQASNQPSAMTVVQLKDELKRRKLKAYGNKAELVERLQAAIVLEGQKDEDENDGLDNDKNGGSHKRSNQHDDDENDDDENDDDDDEPDAEYDGLHRRLRCMLSFKDVEDSIDAFSGDDGKNVNQWIKDFEETAKLCEWSNVQKTIYAKRLLRGSARLFVNYEVQIKTWKNIKAALKTEFSPKVDSHSVHMELQRRKKKVGETYHEYCYRMLEIASQVNMETCAVIRYIIDGVVDDEVNKMILYGANSIAELKRKFDIYENIKSKIRSNARPDEPKKPMRTDNSNDIKQNVQRCFNCGSKGHLSVVCPVKDKGAKCFECNEHGHIAAKCPKRVKVGNKSCNAMQIDSKGCSKNVKVNGIETTALIDTGSDICLMRADFYVKIGAPTLIDQPIKFRSIGSDENLTLGKTSVQVLIDDDDFSIAFHVVPDAYLRHSLLIGTDFLRDVELCIKGDDVKIRKSDNDTSDLPEVNKIDIIDRNNEIDVVHIPDPEITDELRDMICDNKPNKVKDVGVKLTIVLKDDVPVYQRARRLAVSEQKEVNSQIQTWLRDGIIGPTYSDYASPIGPVKKKSGATRICIDYRRLNDKIVQIRNPLPIIDDQVDRLRGAGVFSTIDFENGFFHGSVAEDSRKFTAFIVPGGHYELLKMPFGLCTSPAYFQKYSNAVFNDLAAKEIVSIYMDDLIVPSTDFKEGLVRLKMVLDGVAEHGLAINWNKCQFLQTRVSYLGFVIQNGNVTPSDEKTNAEKHFPVPTNVKAVHSFLGLTGYFRKFIPRYAQIANPLTNLLKDGVMFHFGESELHASTRLKEALSAGPVLRTYCPHAKMKIKEDPELRDLLEREETIIFQEKRSNIREQAKKAISKVQAENKRNYNKKRKASSRYNEGQLVAIKRTQGGPGLKFAAKFLGPYRISRVLRNDWYVVEKVEEGEGPRVTSTAYNFMKPWPDDQEELSSEEDF